MYTIAEIENAVISALDAAPIDGYAKTIGSYSGQFQQDVGSALVILPAVLVVFAGDEFREASGANAVYNRVTDWDVLVACRNLRGDPARRRGAGSEIGIYEMLDDVRAKLTGNRLGLGIEPLRIIRRRPVLIDPRAYVYSVRFQTMLDYEA